MLVRGQLLYDNKHVINNNPAEPEADDLEETVRILAVQCAHYKAKFGELPMSETLDVLNNETMNDERAKRIADGLEMVVGVLGMLEQEHPKH